MNYADSASMALRVWETRDKVVILPPSLIYREYWLTSLIVELTVARQHRVACDLRGRCLPHRQVHASRAKENPLPNSDRRETTM